MVPLVRTLLFLLQHPLGLGWFGILLGMAEPAVVLPSGTAILKPFHAWAGGRHIFSGAVQVEPPDVEAKFPLCKLW